MCAHTHIGRCAELNSHTGGMVTFAKLSESMKSYEFGFRTFLITFSIIIVAEYRQGDPVNIAINRFLIILLGAAIGVSVNIFVFPSWAGEELHYFISNNFDSLAESLEGMFNLVSFLFIERMNIHFSNWLESIYIYI